MTSVFTFLFKFMIGTFGLACLAILLLIAFVNGMITLI